MCGHYFEQKASRKSELALALIVPDIVQFLVLIASWSLIESPFVSLSSAFSPQPFFLLTVVTDHTHEMNEESQLNPS